MCHQRPHPLRWDFRDPYWASGPRAMCPGGTCGTRTPGLRGSIAHSAPPSARCAPPGATEWHSISRQLYICRLPRHSAPPSAQSACHSLPSSGAREAARLEGHQRDGQHRMARGSGSSSGGGGTGRQHGGLKFLTRRDSRRDPSLRGTVPGRATRKAAPAVDVQGYPAHPWKATTERESVYGAAMR